MSSVILSAAKDLVRQARSFVALLLRMTVPTPIFIIAAIAIIASGCAKKDGGWEVLRKVTVTRGDLQTTVSASGQVQPQNRMEIKPSIAGRIEEILVVEGQLVKQGQIMAWMSSVDRASLMDMARAQGPEALARWEDAYKRAPLIAPLAGMVIVRAVEPGQTVTAADAVLVLADRLIVQALVDETDLSLIKLEQRVEIRLDSYPGQVMKGKVDHIAYESHLVNNVSMYSVDILPDEVPSTFRSGMTATVTFILADHSGVLLVPSEAIADWPKKNPRPDATTFAVYQRGPGGKPTPTAVHIGESDGRMTEILDGLKEKDEALVLRRRNSGPKGNPFSSTAARSSGRPR